MPGGIRGVLSGCVAMVAVATLAGCTPGPPVDPLPQTAEPTVAAVTASPTATPTPAVAPEAVAPEPPEAMGLPGPDGAAAAAQYFFDLYAFSFSTGDATALIAMSGPECGYCSSVAENVRGYVESGRSTTGGEISTAVTRSSEISTGHFWIDLAMERQPSQTVDTTGAVVSTTDGGAGTATVIVDGGPDRWTIRAIETHRSDAAS